MLQRIDCPILGAKTASTLAETPELLDLSWRRAGHGRWIAGRTELSDHLLRRFPNATAKAGLRIEDRVVVWDLASAAGVPDLAKRISRWEQDVRQDLAHHARVAQANRGVEEDALSAVQDALADELARHAWAFRSKGPLAWGWPGPGGSRPGRFASLTRSSPRPGTSSRRWIAGSPSLPRRRTSPPSGILTSGPTCSWRAGTCQGWMGTRPGSGMGWAGAPWRWQRGTASPALIRSTSSRPRMPGRSSTRTGGSSPGAARLPFRRVTMTTLRKIFVAILRWYGLMAPAAVPEPPPPAAPHGSRSGRRPPRWAT